MSLNNLLLLNYFFLKYPGTFWILPKILTTPLCKKVPRVTFQAEIDTTSNFMNRQKNNETARHIRKPQNILSSRLNSG